MAFYSGQIIPASLLDRLENPPEFAAYQGAAQSIATATATALTMDTEVVDSYGGHSTVTNTSRYTAQFAGHYLVIAQAAFAVNAVGNRLVEIRQNGSVLPLGQGVGLAPTTANSSANQASVLALLAVGDYVEAFVYQTSGGSLNTNPSQCGMTAIWVHA